MNDELSHYGVMGMKWGRRRYRNDDGSLTKAGAKKDQKELAKKMKERNTDLFVTSNNYAAERINGKWLDSFNKKWSKAFDGYDDWQESPNYTKYENEYIKNLSSLMNESLASNANSKITTKLGSTYTARYMEKYGNIAWATPAEWEANDKK